MTVPLLPWCSSLRQCVRTCVADASRAGGGSGPDCDDEGGGQPPRRLVLDAATLGLALADPDLAAAWGRAMAEWLGSEQGRREADASALRGGRKRRVGAPAAFLLPLMRGPVGAALVRALGGWAARSSGSASSSPPSSRRPRSARAQKIPPLQLGLHAGALVEIRGLLPCAYQVLCAHDAAAPPAAARAAEAGPGAARRAPLQDVTNRPAAAAGAARIVLAPAPTLAELPVLVGRAGAAAEAGVNGASPWSALARGDQRLPVDLVRHMARPLLDPTLPPRRALCIPL
eukprot:tig00000492_g1441.t1